MSHLQCVLLHDVLYVGGGYIPLEDSTKLFMSNIVSERLVWDVCRTPTECYALTTYHSQLVLVGGRKPSICKQSNMLWTLSSDAEMNWQPSIQEMPTKRYGASAMNTGTPEYLVVAGGVGDSGYLLDTVEVFTGKEWCTIEPLPRRCSHLRCTLHEEKYYLFGGYSCGEAMYSCDIKLLLKLCEKSSVNTMPFPLWNKSYLDFPILASFGQHLVSIKGNNYSRHAIVALSPLSQSWVHVGKLPIALDSVASIVLPTGELIVIGSTQKSFIDTATIRGEGDVQLIGI